MPAATEIGLPLSEIIVRLTAAAVIGGLLGLNREIRQKPAGLRTHALVALGAAALVLISLEFPASGQTFNADAMTRVIQGILTGIGFLGAGVIIRTEREQRVHGLTTAASVWIVASLGIACGAGRWRIAIVTVILALLLLTLGVKLEAFSHRVLARDRHDDPGVPPEQALTGDEP